MQTSVGAMVTNSAKIFGDKTALVFDSKTWSFNDIDRMSTRLALQLKYMGVRFGDVVSLYSPNCPEWIISYYGIMKAGAIVNPLNLMLTASEAAFAISDCNAIGVIGASDRLENLMDFLPQTELLFRVSFGISTDSEIVRFSELLESAVDVSNFSIDAEVSGLSISTIAYTSGTTGHPKGAVLSHEAILLNTAMTATMHMRTASDVVVSALPLSHVYGNIVMNTAIAYGMTLVLHKSFDATQVLSSIEVNRATIFDGVPTMYAYLLDHPDIRNFDLSSLTRCTVGGQVMPVAKMRKVEEIFDCQLLEVWGMTEIGGLGCTHSLYGASRLGSIGTSLPHLSIRITSTDDPSCVLPVGEIGELQVKGAIVMKGYLGKQEATLETLWDDGWLRTGDLARMDEDNFVYILDRLKDMIITAGFNIYPAEL